MLTLLALGIIPVIGAYLARFGLIYTYSGVLIAYALTNNIFIAVTTYISISLGNAVAESLFITGDPQILGVTSGEAVVELRVSKGIVQLGLAGAVLKRAGSMLLAMFIIGGIAPKIPIGALPWYLYVIVFGLIIVVKSNADSNMDNPIPMELFGMLALLCWGLAAYLNHIEAPLSTAFIGIAAIGGLLSNYLGIERYVEQPQQGSDFICGNWVEILIATALVWVVPGLTSGVAARSVFSKPNWMLGIGGIDAILEGWTLGTWMWHGEISGKTMLGAALQVWTSRGLSLDMPRLHQSNAYLIAIGAVVLGVIINLILVKMFDPVLLPDVVHKYLPFIIIIPIVLGTIITIRDPIALIGVGLLSVVVSIVGSRPAVRSLAILFVTAG